MSDGATEMMLEERQVIIGNATLVDDMQAGKAGEYLVCADLILKGFVAYPSEQGLPYDVVLDCGGKLLKVQVKATRTHKQTPQRV